MRLLKLSANRPTFRTVIFNREGLSLVIAEQRLPQSASRSSSEKQTYNGVGKSLMLEILHFCLGSNKRTSFEKHLEGWIFNLEIELNGSRHLISRSADKPDSIELNEQPIRLLALRNFLAESCLEFKGRYLTFRSILSRFIRSGRGAYSEFDRANSKEDPYTSMVNTAFLLGLDIDLAEEKLELRHRARSLKKTMKQLEEDPIFSPLMAEETVDIELASLRDRAKKLQQDLKVFRVAEDFHEIEEDANAIKQRLDRHRREEIKLGNAIQQIERSMKAKAELPPDRVFRLYEEAKAALPESVQVRVADVLNFHSELQTNRLYRLSRDRQQLAREQQAHQAQVKELSAQLDEKLRYLQEHQALAEYVAVNNELSEILRRVTKLEESRALRGRVDHELQSLDLALASENLRAGEYIDASEALIDEATSRFRAYAQELYGSRPSGLSIKSDSGDNTLRYRIDAHIRADAAEGINEAKIFCFDMTVLTLGRGHRFEYLAHDSTLFSPVDPRQRLGMFRIAQRVGQELGLQYLAMLNLHDITSIREHAAVDSEELEALFGGQSVVLRLTDEAPSSKLLGIDVDLGDYTK